MISPHRRVIAWPGGAEPLSLWAFDLARADRGDGPGHTLSMAEQARAARFTHAHARARFTQSRHHLRAALAIETSREPSALVISEAPGGKPYLACGSARFNLAHSGDWLVVATHPTAALGVDVECLAPRAGLDRLITRILTPREAAWLAQAPEAERLVRGLSLWTRKEALVKWSGEGLARDPAQLCTQPPWHDDAFSLIRMGGRPVWVLGLTMPMDGAGRAYVGAVAIG